MSGQHESNDHLSNTHSSGAEVEGEIRRRPQEDNGNKAFLKLDQIKILTKPQRIPLLLGSIKAIRHGGDTCDRNNSAGQSEDLISLSRIISHLKDVLSEAEDAKDVFRHADGFETLLTTLATFSESFTQSAASMVPRGQQLEQPQSVGPYEIDTFAGLAFNLIVALNEAIKQHQGNKRYFSQSVQISGAGDGHYARGCSDGWEHLRRAMLSFTSPKVQMEHAIRLFDGLISLALGEECENELAKILNEVDHSIKIEDGRWSNEHINIMKQHTEKYFGERKHVRNPQAVRILLSCWSALRSKGEDRSFQILSVLVLIVLIKLASFSMHNIVALHKNGVLSDLLPLLWTDDGFPAPPVLLELIESLLQLGFPSLKDAHRFIRKAYLFPRLCSTMLKALQFSKDSSFIQFDCSLYGYSSLELPSLGKQFPPTPSAGLTLSAWLRVDQFDPQAHITIFGAFDTTQTCFALAYIEKDSHQLVWQTSVKSSRPSVKFRNFTFERGYWYDISIVHRRPRTLSSSRAFLFVNGELVEQQKCQYPTTVEGRPIQVFVGTPRDLSVKSEKDKISSCWSMASIYLWSDVLSDEFITVRHKLGPMYTGNYQDALGPFQTYQASADLYLRNEMLHPGKEESSHIVSAIKYKAGSLYPESSVLLSISPNNVVDEHMFDHADQFQFLQDLSKGAFRKLQQYIRLKGNAVAINGAIPSINAALLHAHGAALFMGQPVLASSKLLHDQIRCAGGFVATSLHFLRVAKSKSDVLQAMNVIFHSVHSYWRNSEAMESENGFGILAGILASKVGLSSDIAFATSDLCDPIRGGIDEQEALTEQLLELILSFTGYNKESPAESMLVNPLAYRILLVDSDIWRMTNLSTQKLYYGQFASFVKSNKFHRFNCKRLARMRITKKFLEALRTDRLTKDSLNERLKAFEVALDCGRSADILRSVALFITFVLKDAQPFQMRSGRSSSVNSREQSRSGTPLSSTGFPPNNRTSKRISTFGLGQVSGKETAFGLLEVLSNVLCNPAATHDINRFAKTVTNKWIMYLLAEPDGRIVAFAFRILARVLVLNGNHYVKKFSDPSKGNGFFILKMRLRHWFHVPAIWITCYAILFGIDVATVDLHRNYTVQSLLDALGSENLSIVYPEIFPVIAAMLNMGLKSKMESDDYNLNPKSNKDNKLAGDDINMPLKSCFVEDDVQPDITSSNEEITIRCMIRFLALLQSRSSGFRDFASSSTYVQDLLFILFPIIVNSEDVKAETELSSRGSSLNFQGQSVPIRPRSSTELSLNPAVRTVAIDDSTPTINPVRRMPLRRSSSFVLVTSAKAKIKAPTSHAKLDHAMAPGNSSRIVPHVENDLVNELLGVCTSVFTYQVLERKDFQGLGLFLRVPPGFQERQAYFESFLFIHVMNAFTNILSENQKILTETRVLSNMARYVVHMCEAVFEGWFIDGAEPLLDFTGNLLDYLQRPAISQLKSVQLCSQQVASIRTVFLRTALLRLSELNDAQNFDELETFLEKALYWQTVILSPDNLEIHLLRLLCYLLYTDLVSPEEKVRAAAATFWRLFLVQKPTEISAILVSAATSEQKHLCESFPGLSSLDNNELLTWIDSHKPDLDLILHSSMSKSWDSYVAEENRNTRETAKHRILKRKERLRQWQAEEEREDRQWRSHTESTDYWRNNVYASERLKHRRFIQDQQENLGAIKSALNRFDRVLREPCHLIDEPRTVKWRLDETEGRNRMRLRVVPYENQTATEYLSKQKSNKIAAQRPRVQSKLEHIETASLTTNADADYISEKSDVQHLRLRDGGRADSPATLEDDFEIIENPRDDNENIFEDKNRKVMRSLRHGDQVRHVCNVSRVVGLEAFEGLLILGKRALYLLDGFFQRSDGEIVRAWQAPEEERDSYLQMISGQGENEQKASLASPEHNNRNWDWNELISISRRRFLFRDVALEIFFDDGRSYLLNFKSTEARDDLYSKLAELAPYLKRLNSTLKTSDNSWRIDSLRSPEGVPQTLGSKFVNVFNSGPLYTATKSWARGDISNFHYLMLLNTMAGRTFNDLTQYPVFPWVLADYSSGELDLTDPRSFRDLSKPMGCQTPQREAEFRERYATFAEMSDSPPFHYGTHYSSAMIVSSYLIRLQPFVQSYLLLQGGNFDHAERLFHSIENAWLSSSRTNMSDVRELTPEFYYLPDFLDNVNDFDFGIKQETGEKIDNVVLPPWAKGDANVFIAKHREALESEYVSRNLHKWIDLVFGFKQRGEAAIEATNVFHYLSYSGARNLDEIEDPVERAATIGIIHNFGQTPYQICPRAHIPREEVSFKRCTMDSVAEHLVAPSGVLLEIHDRVKNIHYLAKNNRVIASTPLRLYVPPAFDRYLEWGFTDGSVRFFSQDHKKLFGLFEQIHQLQVTCASFAGSKVLITAGTDCTVSAWNIISSAKAIDLQPKGTLYGHLSPVNILEISEAFSTLLSASFDGSVRLWDLNRLKFVRELSYTGRSIQCARINNVTGKIALCDFESVSIYSLNAKLLIKERICGASETEGSRSTDSTAMITCCAFYEGVGNEWLARDLFFTGHGDGKVNIWNIICGAASGQWHLEFIKCLAPIPSASKVRASSSNMSLSTAILSESPSSSSYATIQVATPQEESALTSTAPAITCILPTAQSVYTGDEDGRVFEWTLPKDVAKYRSRE